MDLSELVCSRNAGPGAGPGDLCGLGWVVVIVVFVVTPAVLLAVHVYIGDTDPLNELAYSSPIVVVLFASIALLYHSHSRSSTAGYQRQELHFSATIVMAFLVVSPVWMLSTKMLLDETAFKFPIFIALIVDVGTLVVALCQLDVDLGEYASGIKLVFLVVQGCLKACSSGLLLVSLMLCPLYLCMMARPGVTTVIVATLMSIMGLGDHTCLQFVALSLMVVASTMMIKDFVTLSDEYDTTQKIDIGGNHLGGLLALFGGLFCKNLQTVLKQYAYERYGFDFKATMVALFFIASLLLLLPCVFLEGPGLIKLTKADMTSRTCGLLSLSFVSGIGYHLIGNMLTKQGGSMLRTIVSILANLISMYSGVLVYHEVVQPSQCLWLSAVLLGVIIYSSEKAFGHHSASNERTPLLPQTSK